MLTLLELVFSWKYGWEFASFSLHLNSYCHLDLEQNEAVSQLLTSLVFCFRQLHPSFILSFCVIHVLSSVEVARQQNLTKLTDFATLSLRLHTLLSVYYNNGQHRTPRSVIPMNWFPCILHGNTLLHYWECIVHTIIHYYT